MLVFTMQLVMLMILVVLQIGVIIILRPYILVGSNARPLLNLGITLLIYILLFAMPYISKQLFKLYCPWAIVALLVIAIIYNIYYLI